MLLQLLHSSVGLQTMVASIANRRRLVLRDLASVAALTTSTTLSFLPTPANSLSSEISSTRAASTSITAKQPIAYKSLFVPMQDFGVNVPVACWFPAPKQQAKSNLASYQHRISVRRIGQLLAGWNFIPEFTSRQFALRPTISSVLDGQDLALSSTRQPVVLLCHGYLGSRFDLSHLAERLAEQGFICLAPEYPESLAASYDRKEGLDRNRITAKLLDIMSSDWNIKASSYGIVGHSLGCGTAIQTGDDSWVRVCIAGFPQQGGPSKILFLSSMNDGAVSLERFGGKEAIPGDYILLDEGTLLSSKKRLPNRAAIIFDRPDAPNHISFLSEGVNDAMIDLLSPLLPVAQTLQIPVLDFDRYQASRDSRATADVVHPLVIRYLKEQMLPVS